MWFHFCRVIAVSSRWYRTRAGKQPPSTSLTFRYRPHITRHVLHLISLVPRPHPKIGKGAWSHLASFPGLPRLRFLIASGMQKLSQKLLGMRLGCTYFLMRWNNTRRLGRALLTVCTAWERGYGFWLSFCILEAIKNRSRGRPGNEARSHLQTISYVLSQHIM